MSVDDNWGEALRKAAEQVIPGNKTEYYFKVDGTPSGALIAKLQEILEAVDELEGFTDQLEGYLSSLDAKTRTHPWVNALASKNFISATNLITIPTNAETAFMYVKNPSGSGKLLQIYKIITGLLFNNQNGIYKLYKNPTVTADGTALNITNQRIATSPVASVMQSFRLPTTSSFGTFMNQFPIQQNGPAYTMADEDLLVIEENNSILITVDNAANNMLSAVGMSWMEV